MSDDHTPSAAEENRENKPGEAPRLDLSDEKFPATDTFPDTDCQPFATDTDSEAEPASRNDRRVAPSSLLMSQLVLTAEPGAASRPSDAIKSPMESPTTTLNPLADILPAQVEASRGRHGRRFRRSICPRPPNRKQRTRRHRPIPERPRPSDLPSIHRRRLDDLGFSACWGKAGSALST
jgi:hypothetical protein